MSLGVTHDLGMHASNNWLLAWTAKQKLIHTSRLTCEFWLNQKYHISQASIERRDVIALMEITSRLSTLEWGAASPCKAKGTKAWVSWKAWSK